MTQHIPLPMRIQVIIGSIREGRAADAVSCWTLALPDAVVETLDLREWPLPDFAETLASLGDPVDPTYSTSVVKDWNHRIADADAYIFITPEYNHGIPGVLKNPRQRVRQLRVPQQAGNVRRLQRRPHGRGTSGRTARTRSGGGRARPAAQQRPDWAGRASLQPARRTDEPGRRRRDVDRAAGSVVVGAPPPPGPRRRHAPTCLPAGEVGMTRPRGPGLPSTKACGGKA